MRGHLERAKNLANLLDNQFNILGFRFGLDPILGLIPGSGDIVALVLALYIVWIGKKSGLPDIKVQKMIGNVILDFFIGMVPVVGDLGDFVFNANLMNLDIIEKYLDGNVVEGEIAG